MHERDVPLGQRERDPGRHHRPLPRCQGHVDGREEVGAGVAGMGVRRGRQPRVEPPESDVHHGRRPYPPPAWWPVLLTGFCLVSEDTSVRYRERLSVPLRWWVQATMFLATLWLAFIVATPAWLAWTATGACFAVTFGLLAYIGSARVEVTGTEFAAGPRADPAAPARHPRAAGPRADPAGARRRGRRPRLPRHPALPQGRRAGAGVRPGRPRAVLAGEHAAPGPARRRAARRLGGSAHSEA